MNTNIAYTGNKGDEFPLDCFVKLELKNSVGYDINIHAIGENDDYASIRELTEDILSFFEIDNARIEIFDRGASKPVIAARIEAAVKKITKQDIKQDIYFLPVIETALGVENAFEIATAAEVAGLALGLEDYTADIGAQRTKTAKESFYARTRIVNACKAAGIQAIDSVFSDIKDKVQL